MNPLVGRIRRRSAEHSGRLQTGRRRVSAGLLLAVYRSVADVHIIRIRYDGGLRDDQSH